MVKLFGYDFIIEYKAGKGNRVADALSGQTEKGQCMNAETREQDQKVLKLAAILVPISSWLEEIKELHSTNQHMAALRQQCRENKRQQIDLSRKVFCSTKKGSIWNRT